MQQLPWFIPVTFGITILLAIWLFAKAVHYTKSMLALTAIIIVIQSALGLGGFYNDANTMTTRFPLLLIPSLLLMGSRFLSKKGKVFIDSLDIRMLTLFHTIRVLVEIVLFWLFINHTIPKAMTFEGRNFDILSGLSAPLIYYFGCIKNKISRPLMILWNLACMLLLLNVVTSAVLSLPERFEKFGFEQPNIAAGYFPFLLLPAVLVPLALFCNAAAIRLLIKTSNRMQQE